LDVNALLANEGVSLQQAKQAPVATAVPTSTTPGKPGQIMIVDLSSMKEYPVTPPMCRFGRDISNDIVLTGDKSLSRFHFQISQSNNEFLVEDSGSRNGTFLNGSPCTAPRKVLNGDIISAGMSRYRFVSGEDTAGKNGGGQIAHEEKESKPAVPEAKAAAAQAPAAPAAAAPQVKEEPKAPLPAKAPIPTKDEPRPQAQAQTQPQSQAQPQAKPVAKEEPKPQPQAAQSKPEPVKQQPAAATTAPPKANGSSTTESSAKPAASPAQSEVDPLKKLFDEGQALLNQPATDKPASTDSEEASVDKLLPGKEDELGDTASRFLKMANRNPLDNLFPETAEAPVSEKGQQWPQWCTTFTFPELEDMTSKVKQLEEQISLKQEEMSNLKKEIGEIETQKNRLLATRDADMVGACADIFTKLGWTVKHNGETHNELVLSADDKAVAIARVVSTDAQPKPAEIANLVSSLSTYWCDHGVEPKGILVIAFVLDAPPQSRPELTKDFAEYAAKKNLCLMNSLQLLRIFREIALKKGDKEKIKSELLGASGQLSGFEVNG
jgi:hypothetical protein